MDRSRLFIKLKRGDDVLGVIKKAADNADGKLDDFLAQFEKSISDL